MFEKIRRLQLLVRKKFEDLDAKQTVPGTNGYCQTKKWITRYDLSHDYSGAPRARGRSPIAKEIYPSQKIGNHVTDRPTDRPSAPQAYQCLLSHFLTTLGAQEKADCTSMLSSIDNCQNRVSADHYHLTESRAQVSTYRGRVFFEVIR